MAENLQPQPASRSHVAIIVGVSGVERYLADGYEVTTLKQAKRFRSEGSAITAAQARIASFTPVVRKYMEYKVVPASSAVEVA